MWNQKIFLYLMEVIILSSIVLSIPGTWYGHVTINGSTTNKTNVSIFLNDVHKKTVETPTPNTESINFYNIEVEGTTSDTVYFKVNGINSSAGIRNWSSGAAGDHNLNLSVNKSTTSAVCYFSSGCNEGFCCSSSTEVNSASASPGTCQATACSSGSSSSSSSSGGGGGSGSSSSSGGGGGGGEIAASTEQSTVITDTNTLNELAPNIPTEWGDNTEIKKIDSLTITETISQTDQKTEQIISDTKAQVTQQEAINAIQAVETSIQNNQVESMSFTKTIEVFRATNTITGAEVYSSRITIKVEGGALGKENVNIIEVIPKKVAASIDDIIFPGLKPKILQKDPVIQWLIEKLKAGETKELSYIVKKKLTIDESNTIAVSKKIEEPIEAVPTETVPEQKEETKIVQEEKKQTNLLAILLIIIAVLILILVLRYIRKKVKKGPKVSISGSQTYRGVKKF